MPKRPMNQKQIAIELGISPATVSLVLRDPDTTRASKETKHRIFDLMVTHASRLHAASAKAKTILLITESSASGFYTRMLSGIQDRVSALGLKLEVVHPSQDLQRFVVARYIKGVLVEPHRIDAAQSRLLEKHFRTVTLNAWRQAPVAGLGVQVDEFGGYAKALAYAIERGHRRICFLRQDERREAGECTIGGSRESSFLDACAFMGVHACGAYVERIPNGSGEEGMQAIVKRWQTVAERPSLVICYNDILARHFCSILSSVGIRIPDDVSLIGFDNETSCDDIYPKLTSIAPGWREIGEMGVDLIVNDLFWKVNRAGWRMVSPARLVIRDSVANLNRGEKG